MILGWVYFTCFFAVVLFALKTYFTFDKPVCAGSKARFSRFWKIPAAFVMSRLLFIIAAAVYGAVTRSGRAFGDALYGWDAQHYMNLIRHGYRTEGDSRVLLVFFPLYPMTARLLTFIGLKPKIAAMFLSNGAFLMSGFAMHALVSIDHDETTADTAVYLLMFNPVSFFCSMPYTESTFLLVCLLCALNARKGRFIPALIFGAMASATRLTGLAMAVPVFRAMLLHSGRRNARSVIHCVLCTLPVAVGFLCYLLLNVALYGVPFQFLEFQQEVWTQSFGGLHSTILYTADNMLHWDMAHQLGLWGPQFVVLIGLPVLAIIAMNKTDIGDIACALVMFYVSMSASWLLSGVRYCFGCYAVYPMLASAAGRRKWWFVFFSGAALVYMTIFFCFKGVVY